MLNKSSAFLYNIRKGISSYSIVHVASQVVYYSKVSDTGFQFFDLLVHTVSSQSLALSNWAPTSAMSRFGLFVV